MDQAAESKNQLRNTGPLGSGWRVVERGDCLLSLAYRYGFFWDTLWSLPENSELRDARQDPGQLLTGDRIMIPERRIRTVAASTDAHHRFMKKGIPAKLRLVVEYEDTPVSNSSYVLTIDGSTREGATDEDGLLEVPIPPDAAQGVLEINGLRFDLQLGALDPSSEDIGIQQRLANLGFYRGELDGEIGPVTLDAIATFQARTGLDVTQEFDTSTQDLLLHRHDEPHERLPVEAEPDDSQSSPADQAEPRNG